MKKRIKISQDDINTWKDIRNNALEEFAEKLKKYLRDECKIIEGYPMSEIDKIKKE